jgi:hypothetical protein
MKGRSFFDVFRLMVLFSILVYFCACLWYLLSYQTFWFESEEESGSFITNQGFGVKYYPADTTSIYTGDYDEVFDGTPMKLADNLTMLTATGYFMETTLSSVGYGDMYPMTSMERIYAVFFMLSGSVIFVRLLAGF